MSPCEKLGFLVAVSKRDVDNSSLKRIRSLLLTSRFVTWGQSNVSLVESWSKNIVPFFLGERMSSAINNGLEQLAMRDVTIALTVYHKVTHADGRRRKSAKNTLLSMLEHTQLLPDAKVPFWSKTEFSHL